MRTAKPTKYGSARTGDATEQETGSRRLLSMKPSLKILLMEVLYPPNHPQNPIVFQFRRVI